MFNVLFSYLEKNNVLISWRNYTSFCPGDAHQQLAPGRVFLSKPNALIFFFFFGAVKMK